LWHESFPSSRSYPGGHCGLTGSSFFSSYLGGSGGGFGFSSSLGATFTSSFGAAFSSSLTGFGFCGGGLYCCG